MSDSYQSAKQSNIFRMTDLYWLWKVGLFLKGAQVGGGLFVDSGKYLHRTFWRRTFRHRTFLVRTFFVRTFYVAPFFWLTKGLLKANNQKLLFCGRCYKTILRKSWFPPWPNLWENIKKQLKIRNYSFYSGLTTTGTKLGERKFDLFCGILRDTKIFRISVKKCFITLGLEKKTLTYRMGLTVRWSSNSKMLPKLTEGSITPKKN